MAAGVPFAWVTGDTVYGNDRRLRRWLEEQGRCYVLAIRHEPRTWRAWTNCPIRPRPSVMPLLAGCCRRSAGGGAGRVPSAPVGRLVPHITLACLSGGNPVLRRRWRLVRHRSSWQRTAAIRRGMRQTLLRLWRSPCGFAGGTTALRPRPSVMPLRVVAEDPLQGRLVRPSSWQPLLSVEQTAPTVALTMRVWGGNCTGPAHSAAGDTTATKMPRSICWA